MDLETVQYIHYALCEHSVWINAQIATLETAFVLFMAAHAFRTGMWMWRK
jgi:hypothetical protein